MNTNRTLDWFRFVLFFLYRLRYGFLAILLGIASVFVFRYWQGLTREPNDLIAQDSDSFYSVDLFFPDRVRTGQETKIEVVVDASAAISKTEMITITFSTDDDFAYFDPKVNHLSISAGTRTTGRKKITMGYRNPLVPPQSFNFNAVVSSDNSNLLLNGNVRIDSTSVQAVAIATSLSAAMLSVLTVLLQFKELLSRKKSPN
jgi:hypothetical protein